ncbi:MAG: putative transposase [Acidimicrobiales bacterium]|jgi:putative transposase
MVNYAVDIYHVLNRGVDKRAVVLNDGDRVRFVRCLYVFNDINPPPNPSTQKNLLHKPRPKREKLVHLHAWCLMNNHYHLLLSPVNDDTRKLSLFMKKLNMGYARFFNEKYDRSGYLWQGKFKRILIERDSHFLYIPYYIHLNPLDYSQPEWRQGKVSDHQKTFESLKNYRWSSYQDYIGMNNFPSVISKRLLTQTLGNEQRQTDEIKNIIMTRSLAENSESIEI